MHILFRYRSLCQDETVPIFAVNEHKPRVAPCDHCHYCFCCLCICRFATLSQIAWPLAEASAFVERLVSYSSAGLWRVTFPNREGEQCLSLNFGGSPKSGVARVNERRSKKTRHDSRYRTDSIIPWFSKGRVPTSVHIGTTNQWHLNVGSNASDHPASCMLSIVPVCFFELRHI